MEKKDMKIEEKQLIDFIDSQKAVLRSVYDDFFGPINVPARKDGGNSGSPAGNHSGGSSGNSSGVSSGNSSGVSDSYSPGYTDSISGDGSEGTGGVQVKVGGGGGPSAGAPDAAPEPEKPAEPEIDPMDQLNALIGLTTIKHDVAELTDFAKVQKMRKDAGLKSVPVSLHLVFSGNPGTGKTTVARILGKLYKKIGILSGGQLIEVDRSGLVAGYVGQTAIKTQEQIKKALGGVLFIDEAYSLSKKDDPFGEEAIDTILKAMEDNRDNLVVIVAGYTEPMEKFINSNPGLKSRFNKYIEFPDYTIEELEAIFYQNCERYDYIVNEEIKHHIHDMIVARKFTKLENFANAREVRNMFEEIITNQARRVAALESPTEEDMKTIELEDLADAVMGDRASEEGGADAKAGGLDAKAGGLAAKTGGSDAPDGPVHEGDAEENKFDMIPHNY